MSSKGLKPAIARPSAKDALAAADAVAEEAGLPPAAIAPKVAAYPTSSSEEVVQVNIRVRRALGDQIADRARKEGTTQKILICRALANAGFRVDPDDLRPLPPPRRRGSGS